MKMRGLPPKRHAAGATAAAYARPYMYTHLAAVHAGPGAIEEIVLLMKRTPLAFKQLNQNLRGCRKIALAAVE